MKITVKNKRTEFKKWHVVKWSPKFNPSLIGKNVCDNYRLYETKEKAQEAIDTYMLNVSGKQVSTFLFPSEPYVLFLP